MSLAKHIDITSIINMSNLKKVGNTRGGEYHGACPFCAGTDRFVVWPADNAWSCRQCVSSDLKPQDAIEYVMRSQGIKFPQALEQLGIANSDGRYTVKDSKGSYRNLADYAQHKDVPVEFFQEYGWQDESELFQGRQIISYPTYGRNEQGETNEYIRVRFLDGNKPPYMPKESGYPTVWYGLKKAIALSQDTKVPLIFVNGESSAISGHYRGVPSFAKTGGEGGGITDSLMSELKMRYPSGLIVIAPDNDSAGDDSAKKHAKKLESKGYDVHILDMNLGEHGDFADFCMLHNVDTPKELQKLIPTITDNALSAHAASKRVLQFVRGEITFEGRPLPFPFKTFYHLQGMCRIMPPGWIMLLFAMSGHGKTSFAETMVEFWLQRGYRGIYDGREFSSEAYHFRRVQRCSDQKYNGQHLTPVKYTEFLLHQKWTQEQDGDVPAWARDGVMLSDQKIKTIEIIDNIMEKWTGHLEYAPRTKDVKAIENLFLWMESYIKKERDEYRHIDFVVFDYLHLYHTKEKTDSENKYMTIANLIKDFCQEQNVLGIILAQVNKKADNNQRENNRPLTIADARYINDQFANLTISLNIRYGEQYNPDGSKKLDWQGNSYYDKAILPDTNNQAGMVNVIKNTMEQTGYILLQAQFSHYRWLDETWSWERGQIDDDNEIDDNEIGDESDDVPF